MLQPVSNPKLEPGNFIYPAFSLRFNNETNGFDRLARLSFPHVESAS